MSRTVSVLAKELQASLQPASWSHLPLLQDDLRAEERRLQVHEDGHGDGPGVVDDGVCPDGTRSKMSVSAFVDASLEMKGRRDFMWVKVPKKCLVVPIYLKPLCCCRHIKKLFMF